MLADLRAAPVRTRAIKNTRPTALPPAPKLYKVLDKQVPMSFSSYLSNPEAGGGSKYCIKPWESNMSLYKASDVPLGVFLLSYCFDKEYR